MARARLTVLETFPVSGMGPVLPHLPDTGPAILMSGFLCYLNHTVSAAAPRAEPSAGLKVEDEHPPPQGHLALQEQMCLELRPRDSF